MGSADTRHWEQARLGGPVEYPGHPLVLATMILDRYETLEQARAPDPATQRYRATGDLFLPGSGEAIDTAISLLECALAQPDPTSPAALAEACAQAEAYWRYAEQVFPENPTDPARGRAQGERIQAAYRERLQGWARGTPLASRYRVPQLQAA